MHIIRHGQRVEVGDNYILKSGESLALPLSFADHDTQEQRRALGLSVVDAYGVPSGHSRGYVFTVDASVRQRAIDAYDERSRWMENAWRHRDGQDHDQDDGREDQKTAPPRSLADAQAAAERAYAERNEWLRTAWREGRDAA
jgi:hypothetical protein